MSTGHSGADKTVIHWLEGVVAQAPDGGWCVWLNEPPAGVPQAVPLDRHAPGLEHAALAHGVSVVVSLRERCGRWSAFAIHRSTPCERVPLPGGQGSPQLDEDPQAAPVPRSRVLGRQDLVQRAAQRLVRHHGSPQAAILALRQALDRLRERFMELPESPAAQRRIDHHRARDGWWSAVGCELLRLRREGWREATLSAAQLWAIESGDPARLEQLGIQGQYQQNVFGSARVFVGTAADGGRIHHLLPQEEPLQAAGRKGH